MARNSTATDLWIALVVTATWQTLAMCCSPPPPGMPKLSLTEQVYHTNTVFQGKILRKWKDERLSTSSAEAFIVEAEVYCILKGVPLPPMVNISNVGKLFVRCSFSSKLY